MAALFVAIFGNQRRAVNKARCALISQEDPRIAIRLNQPEINTLIQEYNNWRSVHFGIKSQLMRSEARMISFLTFLSRGGFFHQVGGVIFYN